MKVLLVVLGCLTLAGSSLASPPAELRQYHLEATCDSLDKAMTLDSYRREGLVSGTVGSTIGIGRRGVDRPVAVSIQPLLKAGRFIAEVTFEPTEKGEARVESVDLTDLKPVVLEVTTDSDGRRYQLTLTPTVDVTDLRGKPFSEATAKLYSMQFHYGAVVMNDNRYIGRMSASDAEFFSIDICDVALVEFSLHHLKDAQPWGTLKEGRLVITNPQTSESFELNGVTNGSDERVVPGGPYQVWVRWNDPNTTSEALRTQLTKLQERVTAGEFEGRPHMAERIAAELAREPGPWVVGSGARGVGPNELVGD